MSNPPINTLTGMSSSAAFENAVEEIPDNPQPTGEISFVNIKLEQEIRRAYLITLQDNNTQRRRYAVHTFVLTCCWIGVVIIIVVLTGLRWLHLSDPVLITLITTTTASVFGFFLLVMKYLFNTGLEKPKEDNDAPQ